jgi:hypothetical protein
MVLLASYMVGPYTDRVATFLGYPVGFVPDFLFEVQVFAFMMAGTSVFMRL